MQSDVWAQDEEMVEVLLLSAAGHPIVGGAIDRTEVVPPDAGSVAELYFYTVYEMIHLEDL